MGSASITEPQSLEAVHIASVNLLPEILPPGPIWEASGPQKWTTFSLPATRKPPQRRHASARSPRAGEDPAPPQPARCRESHRACHLEIRLGEQDEEGGDEEAEGQERRPQAREA